MHRSLLLPPALAPVAAPAAPAIGGLRSAAALAETAANFAQRGALKGASEYYRQAAELGLASAQFTLGQYYSTGQGVTKSDATAFEWFAKAAEQKHVAAQREVALALLDARGVASDTPRTRNSTQFARPGRCGGGAPAGVGVCGGQGRRA